MAMPERRRVKHTLTFAARLKLEAARLRQEAEREPPGPERDKLIRKAGQVEAAPRELGLVAQLEAADVTVRKSAQLVPSQAQDEIASRQLHAVAAFQRPREKKLRLADVEQMFLQMRDHA